MLGFPPRNCFLGRFVTLRASWGNPLARRFLRSSCPPFSAGWGGDPNAGDVLNPEARESPGPMRGYRTRQSPRGPVESHAQLDLAPAPFIYHTRIWPAAFWQRMSVLPSLL